MNTSIRVCAFECVCDTRVGNGQIHVAADVLCAQRDCLFRFASFSVRPTLETHVSIDIIERYSSFNC